MAATKATGSARMLAGSLLHSQLSIRLFRTALPPVGIGGADLPTCFGHGAVRFAATKSGGGQKKSPARLAEVQRLLYQAEERYRAGGDIEPIPKITLDDVTISYANSGSGGQNFNKAVKTKVDMRFNVRNAQCLNERVKERIMQMGRNLINKDGEIVISKKIITPKSKAEDALAKLQVFAHQKKKLQAIIDAASYVSPPLSVETVKKITELSAHVEEKQRDKKKLQSQKNVV